MKKDERLEDFVWLFQKTTQKVIHQTVQDMANSYKMSDGTRVTKSDIDKKVYKAKAEKIEQMMDEHGYIFCEEEGCGKNASSGEPIDCSHTISVDKCQKEGTVELAWAVSNIKMRCRTCHRKLDKTFIGNG